MSRTFALASSQYLTVGSTPISAYPLTMACWFKANNTNAYKTLMSLGSLADDTHHTDLYAGGVANIEASQLAGGSRVFASATANYSTSGYQHAAGVFNSATDRRAFYNGANKGTDTTSATFTATTTRIGIEARTSLSNYHDGDIAEAAIWNIALADTDVLMLGLGVSPLFVRPDALVFYAPLIGVYSPEIDVRGGLNLTLTNTPTQGTHTRMFYTMANFPVRFNSGTPAVTNNGRMFACF